MHPLVLSLSLHNPNHSSCQFFMPSPHLLQIQILPPPLLPYSILPAHLCLPLFPLSLFLPVHCVSLQLSLYFQHYFQVIPLYLLHYLSTSMAATKYKKNSPSNCFLCLETEHPRAVTAEKTSPSLQVPSRDHHKYMHHHPSWRNSEE